MTKGLRSDQHERSIIEKADCYRAFRRGQRGATVASEAEARLQAEAIGNAAPGNVAVIVYAMASATHQQTVKAVYRPRDGWEETTYI